MAGLAPNGFPIVSGFAHQFCELPMVRIRVASGTDQARPVVKRSWRGEFVGSLVAIDAGNGAVAAG